MVKFNSSYFFIVEVLLMQTLCFALQNDSQSIYDQRQNGKYNIHISLKDVTIIEVNKNDFVGDLNENSDEYYYDDGDLTIKPISDLFISTTTTLKTNLVDNRTTIEPLDTQSKENEKYVSTSADPLIALRQLVEPVSHVQEVAENNFSKEHTKQKSQHQMNTLSKFGNRNRSESRILNVLSARPLTPKSINPCKRSYMDRSNKNCRESMRLSVLKDIFHIWRLFRKTK